MTNSADRTARVRTLFLALPEVTEGSSYGTTGFKVKTKFLARLRDDDTVLVLRMNFLDREALMQAEPETYYITDHYRDYPAVLIRLAAISDDALRDAIEEGWRFVAPPRLVATYDAARGASASTGQVAPTSKQSS